MQFLDPERLMLLEARPQPLLDKLHAAVRADALHYPAHSSLVLALAGAAAFSLSELRRPLAALALAAFFVAPFFATALGPRGEYSRGARRGLFDITDAGNSSARYRLAGAACRMGSEKEGKHEVEPATPIRPA